MSTLTRRLAIYLFSHSHLGSLPVYSLALTQACCLSILTPSGSLPIYSHSHSGLLPIYSHSIRLAAYLFSLSLRLAACLSSHYQAHFLSIPTLSGSLPVILTLSGSLSIYSHTIRLAACHPHTIRLTFYLFPHSCYCVYLFSHPMLLRHSCSLAHQCIRAHSRAHCLSILILATHISSPTPRYLVPTIRFATYLALVCFLATARLITDDVLSCLSSICSCSYPSSHSDLLPI